MSPDGSELKIVIDPKQWKGGHHPNWVPNSTEIIMNLIYKCNNVRFGIVYDYLEKVARRLKVRYFSNSQILRVSIISMFTGKDKSYNFGSYGSGYPSFNPKYNYVVTD